MVQVQREQFRQEAGQAGRQGQTGPLRTNNISPFVDKTVFRFRLVSYAEPYPGNCF